MRLISLDFDESITKELYIRINYYIGIYLFRGGVACLRDIFLLRNP